MEEAQLVRRSQRGDEAAYRLLIERYQGRMYHVLYRLLSNREDALDGCQEVFWRAWRNLGQFDSTRPLQPWLDRIATNYAYDCLRRRQRAPLETTAEVDLTHVPDERAGPEGRALQQEASGEITAAIARLAPEYRLVLTLRHVRGLSYQEIALELDWPLSLVKNRLFRARNQLKKALTAKAPEGRHGHAVGR